MTRERHLHAAHLTIRKYEDVDVIRPPFLKIPASVLYKVTNRNIARAILKATKRYNGKLIHAHFGQNGAASLLLKHKMRVPLVTSFYGHDAGNSVPKFANVYQNLIEEGEIFLALSDDMKMDLMHHGFPEKKIQIHHLGVDIDEFKTNKKRKGDFQVLVVANLLERKGIHHALQAFAILNGRFKDTQMTIIGAPGPYQKMIFHIIKKLGLQDVVAYINNMTAANSRQVVRDHMTSCDIFVLPSLTLPDGSKEGTPVVLMEAQACSKPCISTYHAGIPEVVLDKRTGFLVDEKDVESIAERMEQLYSEEELRRTMGAEARRHVEEEFNTKRQVIKLLAIYRNLLEKYQ